MTKRHRRVLPPVHHSSTLNTVHQPCSLVSSALPLSSTTFPSSASFFDNPTSIPSALCPSSHTPIASISTHQPSHSKDLAGMASTSLSIGSDHFPVNHLPATQRQSGRERQVINPTHTSPQPPVPTSFARNAQSAAAAVSHTTVSALTSTFHHFSSLIAHPPLPTVPSDLVRSSQTSEDIVSVRTDKTDRETNIVWSGWDYVPLVKNKPPQRCLLTATTRSLTIWDVPLTRSSGQPDSVVEILTITSDCKDDWVHKCVRGDILLGAFIPESHKLLIALHFPSTDKTHSVSAIALHHPETLTFQRRIVLDGKIVDVQRSSHAVVVSTLDPPAIHLFHPATFQPLCSSITFPTSYPPSQAPVFTLSHRLFAFATTQPPGPSAPPLRRASGTRTETISHERPRPSLAHNVPIWSSADSARSRLGRSDDRAFETEEDPIKLANEDEEGEWTGGSVERSSSSASSVDPLDSHIPKSRPIPASPSASRDRYSGDQHSYQSPQPSFQSRQHSFPSHLHSYQSHSGQHASFAREEQSVQIIDLHALSTATVNGTAPHCLSSTSINKPPLVHFYPSPIAHSTQPINYLSFSPNSQMLLISQAPSCSFAVVEIRPARRSPHPAPTHSMGEVWERYVLRRGVSEAVVKSVSWDNTGRWVAVATGKGTLHIYPLNPYGGPPIGHRQGKVLNALDIQPLSTTVQPALRIHQTRQIPPSSTPSPMSVSKVLPPGDCLTPPNSPPFSSSLRKLSQLSASSAAAAPSALLSSTGFKPPNLGDLSLPSVTCCFLAPERVRASGSTRIGRPANHSPGRFQPADTVSGSSGPPETAQDILVFYPTVGLLSLQKVLFCPVSSPTSIESTPSVSPMIPKSPSGPSSALSLMMMAKKRAEGIVSGSTTGGLEAEVKSWEGAAWEFSTVGSETEDVGLEQIEPTRPGGKQGSLAENNKQGLVPWSLSRAEIQTVSSSLKILPGPLYLSHQFEFHHLPLPVSPSVHHIFPSLPSTSKLVVRNEVLLTSPSTSPYPLDPVSDGFTPSTSHPSRGSTPIGSHSHSGGSFDRLLEKAIESSLGDPTGRPARPIIPAYPNGDGPTISPRSWKRVPVLVSSTANVLGELKREIGERVGSPSGSFSGHSSFSNNNYLLPVVGAAGGGSGGGGVSAAVGRRFSANKNNRPNGLSFEDETVSDPTEFIPSILDGSRAADEGDRWEDEDEGAVERYRRLAEEEDEFDDLVCGVEDWDTDRPSAVEEKVERRSRGETGL